MIYQNQDKKQLSPCIVAWARYVLEIGRKRKPRNNKKCSENYWKTVIEIVGKHHKKSQETIAVAVTRYLELFSG